MASNSALATISSADLAQGTTFSPKQVDLIREQIADGASDDELLLFLHTASSRGLDPFRKHIFAVSRWDSKKQRNVFTFQVSIDGLRLIAQRSGRYEGQTPPQWCGPDGRWTDVWLAEEPPAAAKVGVYIKGAREPLYAIALYRTFVQTYKPKGSSERVPTSFWLDMPEHMLAKCAEAQALRKAFPEEAGGLYTSEEMNRDDYPEAIDSTTGEVRRQPTPIRAKAEVVDPGGPIGSTDSALADAKTALWDLAHHRYGWSGETLNLVARDWADKDLTALDAQELQDLCKVLATESEPQRQTRLDRATSVTSQTLTGI